MYEIKDKIVLVTGGGDGIGAGIVKMFLDEGAKYVAILDLDTVRGEALEKKLNTEYGTDKSKFFKCDVTSDELNEVYDSLLNKLGYIDVVINNAALLNDSPSVYKKAIATNLTALITSSLRAYNLMRKDYGGKGGTIINISSLVALCQTQAAPIYSATKSAVLQFSNILGMDPHYSRSKVRVITVCYGVTDTALLTKQKLGGFDNESDDSITDEINKLPIQSVQSAVNGLLEAYRLGDGGSTWLVTSEKPAKDITQAVKKAYEIMGATLEY